MPAVDTERPRVIYLSFEKGQIQCYDSGNTTMHKAWKGYVIGFKYRTMDEGAKFGNELHILLAEGSQVYDMGMILKSGVARQFMACAENIDFRLPVTFRPWKYEDDGKVKTGGLNIEQGGANVAPVYTTKNPGPMPLAEEIDDGGGTMMKNFGKQVAFLRAILDEKIAPKVAEIVEKGDFMEESIVPVKQFAPMLSGGPAPLQLAPKSEAPSADAPVPPPHTLADAPPEPIRGDEDDLPF